MTPTVIVVAGPNGAGKTTLARELLLSRLPDYFEFLNADMIAEGLSPFKPETVVIEAGRQFLKRFESNSVAKKSFVVESTLSGRSLAIRLQRLKKQGYRIELIFLWLPNSDFAVMRVAQRVRLGGHDIPEPTIRRRFNRSISNFFNTFKDIGDSVALLDGSRQPPEEVANWANGELKQIFDEKLYEEITESIHDKGVKESKAVCSKDQPKGYIQSCLHQLLEDIGRFLSNLEKETGIPLVVRKD